MVYFDNDGSVKDYKTMAGHLSSGNMISETKIFTLKHKYAYATREGFGRLRRTITSFIDQDSKEASYAVVNYKLSNLDRSLQRSSDTEMVFSKPHGNAKKRKENYIRTKPSVLRSIKEYSRSMRPKQVISTIQKDAGGVYGMKCPSDIVRNRSQVYNAVRRIPDPPKARSTGKVRLTDYAKVLSMLQENDFVKDVSFGARDENGKYFAILYRNN